MATQTKSVSGNTTTYVITGENNNTTTVAVTQTAGAGITTTITATSAQSQDAMQALVTLLQLTSTGVVP